jgi:predicted short-subunit dehydrogenase-like oxidoreductase (DUF2520 family)
MREDHGMSGTPSIVPPLRSVGLVGPGRAGAVVAAALALAGHRVIGWTGRQPASAAALDRMARLLPGVPRLPLDRTVAAADVVLLAVPDAALAGAVEAIAGLPVAGRAGTAFWHLSGAAGVGPLGPLCDADGVRLLALHPAMTFTGTAADLPRLEGVSWACTYDEGSTEPAHALVHGLGGRPVDIAEDDRPRYHAALSHASNFLTVLQAQAADLLRSIGVVDPASMLGPLVRSALANALLDDPVYTGPISRGDAVTVRAHLEVLDDPDTRLAYAALSTATLHRLLSGGALDDVVGRAVAAVLAGRPGSES